MCEEVKEIHWLLCMACSTPTVRKRVAPRFAKDCARTALWMRQVRVGVKRARLLSRLPHLWYKSIIAAVAAARPLARSIGGSDVAAEADGSQAAHSVGGSDGGAAVEIPLANSIGRGGEYLPLDAYEGKGFYEEALSCFKQTQYCGAPLHDLSQL